MRARWLVASWSLVGVLAGVARAGPAAEARQPARRGRAVPVAVAVVPGVLLHGAGHFAAGERRTATRLFAIEGLGLGMAAAGGAHLYFTGASRHDAGPAIAMVVSGAGLFGMSWLADLYGAAGGGHAAGEEEPAPLEVDAGYGYVDDPQFEYRQFAVIEGRLWFGPVRVEPSAWIAADDDNQRMRLEGAWRLLGARSRRPTGDGSRVEVVAAATHHRYPDDGFAVTTGEVAVGGRLDMARVGASMAGSFAELSLGAGSELTNYYRPGAGADLGELLLVRFGYGVRLGRPGGVQGEAALYYDHRRDTFAGGLSPGPGPGSGFAGFMGAGLHLSIGERWGIRAELEQGAARVAHVGLTMRFGGVSWR